MAPPKLNIRQYFISATETTDLPGLAVPHAAYSPAKRYAVGSPPRHETPTDARTPRKSPSKPRTPSKSPAKGPPKTPAKSPAKQRGPAAVSVTKSPKKPARTYEKVVCKLCYNAYQCGKTETVDVLDGRAAKIKTHYANCKFTAHLRQVAASDTPWDAERVRQFHRLLLDAQADSNVAASFIDRKSWRRLIAWLNPAAELHIPNRRGLGGYILERAAKECEAADLEELKSTQTEFGGRVNLLSDGWTNISKRHILGCQCTLFGHIYTQELLDPGTKHDAVALAVIMEGVIERMAALGLNIGGFVTDNAGQCAKCRRMLIKKFPKIAFLRCFAHDVNNLVKDVLKTNFTDVARTAAQVVNYLNSASSTWLVHVRDVLSKLYGKELAFVRLCDTRWNSIQGCFASLTRVQHALQMLVTTTDNVPSELMVLKDQQFWTDLLECERILQPLCNASHLLQRDENTLADVIVSYRDIYFGFATNEKFGFDLVATVEKRWWMCEQPLFLLGFALHPAFRDDMRITMEANPAVRSFAMDAAVYYYRRYIGENFGQLRSEFQRWHGERKLTVDLNEFEKPVPSYWQYVGHRFPLLSKLAIVILSIAVNSATCERLFSSLGAIHSPARNRLQAEKTRKLFLVQKRVREDDGNVRARKKTKRILDPTERQFVDATADTGENDEMGDGALTVCVSDSFMFMQMTLEDIFRDEDVACDYRRGQDSSDYDPYEAIPDPVDMALDDPKFVQESKITGFRSWSMPLAELFPLATKEAFEKLVKDREARAELFRKTINA